MGEAAAPGRPEGRNIFVPRSESAKVGDPEVSALRVATEGVSDFHRFRSRDKDVSPCGPSGSRSLFHLECWPNVTFS
eukprot:2093655-Alexandrium_andersonii.AAC.1